LGTLSIEMLLQSQFNMLQLVRVSTNLLWLGGARASCR